MGITIHKLVYGTQVWLDIHLVHMHRVSCCNTKHGTYWEGFQVFPVAGDM